MGKLNLNQPASASPSSYVLLQQFESPIDNQNTLPRQEPTRTFTIPKPPSKSQTSENIRKPVIAPIKIEESNSSKRSGSKSSFQIQNTMKPQNIKVITNHKSLVSKSSKLSHMNSRLSSDNRPQSNSKKRHSHVPPSKRAINLNSINKQKLLSNCEHSLEFILVAICKAFDFQNAMQAAQFVARGSNSEYASRLKNIDNFSQLNQFLSLLQTNLKTLIKILESENDYQLHNNRGKNQQDSSQNKIMSIISMGLQLSVDERIVWQTCNLLSAIFQNLNGFSVNYNFQAIMIQWVLNCDHSGKLQEITPSSEDFISSCLRARRNHSELNNVIISLFYEAANIGSHKRKKHDSSVSQLINLFLIALPNYFRNENEYQFYQLVQEIIGSHFFQYEKERLDKQHLLFTMIDQCIDNLSQLSLIDFENMEPEDHEYLGKSLNLRQSCITLLCSIWINNEQIFHLSVAKFQSTYSQLQASCCSEDQNLNLCKQFTEFQTQTPISKIVLLMMKRNLSDPSKLIKITIYQQLAQLLKLFAQTSQLQHEEIVFKQLSFQYITLLKASRTQNNLKLREVISTDIVEYLEHAKKPDLLSFSEMFFKHIKNQIVQAQNQQVQSLPSPMFQPCDLQLLKAIITSQGITSKAASILYTALAQSIFFDKFNDYTSQKYLTKLLIRLFTGFEQELAANWAKLFQLGCSVLSKIDQQLNQFHIWFLKLLREQNADQSKIGCNSEILKLVRRALNLTSKSPSIESNQQQVLSLILKKELIIQTLLNLVVKSQMNRNDTNSVRRIAHSLLFEQRVCRSLNQLKSLIEQEIQKLQQQTKRRSVVTLGGQKTLGNGRQKKQQRMNNQIYVSSPIKDIIHNQYKGGRRQTIIQFQKAQVNGLAGIQAQRQFQQLEKLETFSNPLNNSNIEDEIINLNQKIKPRRNSVIIGYPLYFKMDTNVPEPSEHSAYMKFKFKKDIHTDDTSSITTLRTEIYTSDAGDDDIGVNAYVSTYKKKQIEENTVEISRGNTLVVKEESEQNAVGSFVQKQQSSQRKSEEEEGSGGILSTAKRSKSFIEKKEPEPEIQKGATKEFAGVMGIIRTKKKLMNRARKKQEEKTNKAIYDVVQEAFKIVARDIEEIERKGFQSAERLTFITELLQKFNENDKALKEKLGIVQSTIEVKPKVKKAVVIMSPEAGSEEEKEQDNNCEEDEQSHDLSAKNDQGDVKHKDPRFMQAATISIKSSFMPKKTIILEESMEMSKKNAIKGMNHSSQDSMLTEPNENRFGRKQNQQMTIPIIQSSDGVENLPEEEKEVSTPNHNSGATKGKKATPKSSNRNPDQSSKKKLKIKLQNVNQSSKKVIKPKKLATITAHELDSRIADLKKQSSSQKRLAGTHIQKQPQQKEKKAVRKGSEGRKKMIELIEQISPIHVKDDSHEPNQDLQITDQNQDRNLNSENKSDLGVAKKDLKRQSMPIGDSTPARVQKQISALFRKDSVGERRKSMQIYEQQMKNFGFEAEKQSQSSDTLRDIGSNASQRNLRPQSIVKSASAIDMPISTANMEHQRPFPNQDNYNDLIPMRQISQPIPEQQQEQQHPEYQAFLDQLKTLQQLQINLQLQLMNIQTTQQVAQDNHQFNLLKQQMDRANQMALQLSQFQIPQAQQSPIKKLKSEKKSAKSSLPPRQHSSLVDCEVEQIKSINLNLKQNDIDTISQKASERIAELKMRRNSKLSATLLQQELKYEDEKEKQKGSLIRIKSTGNVFEGN